MKKEFLQPIPRSLVWDLLEMKMQQVQSGELDKLPYAYCVTSLLYDMQNPRRDCTRSQADYARMWGWSTGWVSKHWDRLQKDAQSQARFYADKEEILPAESEDAASLEASAENTHRERTVNARERAVNDNLAKTALNGTSVNGELTHRERTVNAYYTESLDNREKDSLSTRTQARGKPPEKAPSPPSESDLPERLNFTSPVEAYQTITDTSAPLFFREKIMQTVGRDPAKVRVWAELCAVWYASSYNTQNVPKMLQAFEETWTNPAKRSATPEKGTRYAEDDVKRFTSDGYPREVFKPTGSDRFGRMLYSYLPNAA